MFYVHGGRPYFVAVGRRFTQRDVAARGDRKILPTRKVSDKQITDDLAVIRPKQELHRVLGHGYSAKLTN
ncbi:hypothetical protein GCM10027535_05930 [Mycolicibacterium hippocampi]|uniref:Uncharacterized protein n=1 Tax=Mycolicibacterium hippocampi TaxID=659824 RepID=A0A7I9ZKZ0_9MYCO|nr:hypothetical protein MHIP_19520 [Mycolicibacterium hippocampi]